MLPAERLEYRQADFLGLYEPPLQQPAAPASPAKKHKPKQNHIGTIYTPEGVDLCQTPPYAVAPLIPYLKCLEPGPIWEPCAGERYLARAMEAQAIEVITSDIQTGQNFFFWQPDQDYRAIVTNPPYSIKYQIMAHCFEIGKPFALLVPVETLGAKSAQKLFRQSTISIEVVFLDRRVNFKMPRKGWDGSAQFPTCWITWQIQIGQQMTFAVMPKE